MKSSRNEVVLRGVRVNNLKNINLTIPSNKLVVVTGLSGSGKSSLVFDTLYAEGQRRYVESLSAYARQFLGKISKPEVDFIEGIAPAIAIEQKTVQRNPRSTVGTITEIYEYIKLMYARIGEVYSPISGNKVQRHSVTNVTDFIFSREEGHKIIILAPLCPKKEMSVADYLNLLLQMGFSRLYKDGEIIFIQDAKNIKGAFLLVDRIVLKKDDTALYSRVFDSVQTAFFEGEGRCEVEVLDEQGENRYLFSNHFELDGMTFVKPSVNFFSFNNPYGACPHCEGLGEVIGISEDLVIPNINLSVYQDAVACWRGEKMTKWKQNFIANVENTHFPIHKPYKDLTEEQKKILWNGNGTCQGILDWYKFVREQSYKIHYGALAARYKGRTICPECKGSRLRSDAFYVKINGKSILDLVNMPIEDLVVFFKNIQLSEHERQISHRLLLEINQRLAFLLEVGLPYLTLSRKSTTLSGGESQRIHLATSLGSALVGSMYILDEPSIGLHPKDGNRLIEVVKRLRDLGNTVIVVEHDEDMMLQSDQIIDIGPMAGEKGGEVVFQGSPKELLNFEHSITADYLKGVKKIEVPKKRRKWKEFIALKGVNQHNLKNVDVVFPLNVLTVVTGVSGSGKTSLVKQTLYPALQKQIDGYGGEMGKFDCLEGDWKLVEQVEMIDQNPIGRSSRSNPATYTKAFDDIRTLFASQKLAKVRKYTPGTFSFNIEGGRCEECEGDGVIKVEMQFMADLFLVCENCHGKRYKDEILEVTYKDKNIADVLDTTIDDAIEFFEEEKTIVDKLKPLQSVGLGYLRLGQASNSLSGGEIQRVKLAYFLGKGHSDKRILFIFDEPTTGLHFHDIHYLQLAFDALIEKGHTIIVVEHHLDIIKLADWIIDVGPDGGHRGGEVLFEGTPENLVKVKKSYTGTYLKSKLK